MEWRKIADPALQNRYEVSEDGRIRNDKGRDLYTYVTNSGYRMVQLGVAGKRHRRYVHRLVAASFVGEPSFPKLTVNHKDGDKLNNHFSNLEWMSYGENNSHAARVLGVPRHNQRLTREQADEVRGLKASGMTQRAIARRYNVSPMVVSRLINNMQLAYDCKKAA